MQSKPLTARVRLGLTGPSRALSAPDALEQLLGYPPEEFLSARISLPSCIHAHDRERAQPLFAPDLSSPAGSLNLRLRHRDGAIVCVRAEYTKERDPASGDIVLDLVLRVAGPLWDSSLQAIFASFRALMGDTDDYMYVKDRNHVFIGATPSMLHFLRGEQQKLGFAGRTVYDLHPESLADQLYRLDQLALEGQCVHEIQAHPTDDGSTRWIDNRKYPLRNESGEVIGIFGICPDITDPLNRDRKARETAELLRVFIENAPAALAMFDRDMRYLAVSRRWMHEFASGQLSVIGRSHYETMPDLPDSWREEHLRALAGETVVCDEDQFVRADGSVHWVRRELHPWFEDDGNIGGILLLSEDITEGVRDREQLQLAASVFTNAREGIIICDPRGNILDVNEMFTRITGYRRDDVLGRNPRILKSGRQSEEFYADMWRALRENGQWSGELWNKAKDGRIYPEALTISAVYDHAGKLGHYVAIFSDITELKEHKRQMERVSHFDALTNLPNRALLADRLNQAMAHARRRKRQLAVACLDLDGFRRVNERYGHDTGDKLLMTLAHRMKTVLREADTLARLGGDKFVAVLLDVGDPQSSGPLLERLLLAATEPNPCGQSGVPVSASMGVVFYPQASEVDAGHLLRQAEQGMFQAKLAGKNRYVVFDPAQDAVASSSWDELEQIRSALDTDELILHYQPRVHMGTGALIGAEALVRWQHPTRGLLPPAMFLPAIEEHTLIDSVGEWVIDRALTQHERWRAVGIEIPISVNIAAHHLQSPVFAERLRLLLASHPTVLPGFLELEVLESSALRDVAQVSEVLANCRELGVSVSLDDFGTGYSSLTWLRRLPVNILKIDQSFVRGMLDSPEDIGILEGVLSLAGALDRTPVAEGVETVEHGRLLLHLGCVYGQGYGIAHPMPPETIPAWAAAWRPDEVWRAAYALPPARRALLQAAVAHRAWVAATESFLRGVRHAPPKPETQKCRLARWIDAETSNGVAPRAFAAVAEADQQLHRFINELLAAPPRPEPSADNPALAELDRLHVALRDSVNALLTKPTHAG